MLPLEKRNIFQVHETIRKMEGWWWWKCSTNLYNIYFTVVGLISWKDMQILYRLTNDSLAGKTKLLSISMVSLS